MYKYFIFFLSVFLTVRCDLNKEEGAECEWEGVKGFCINQNRCFTSLDRRSDRQPVCSTKGETKIICCTDCELVNDTSNAIFSPRGGVLWKDGSKARDSCLEYLDKQHYRCRDGGFYGGLKRSFDAEKKCHRFSIWAIGGAPSPGHVPGPEYPHQALLGFESKGAVTWKAGGSIISNKYILTAAHINNIYGASGELKHVAMGVVSFSDSSTRQKREVKRFIPHPDYNYPSLYHDIALIELVSLIEFNKYAIPACLYTATTDIQTALTTTWRDLKRGADLVDTIQTINVEAFSDEECKTAYPKDGKLEEGFDSTTQLCYGSKIVPSESCRGFSGEPLLAQDLFADCIHSIIGVTSLGASECGSANVSPNIYTKISYYLPWIESVVWPYVKE